MNFCEDITNNILSHDQLLDFAIKCDIPTKWVEKAKEDYLHDLEMIVTKVFLNGWADLISTWVKNTNDIYSFCVHGQTGCAQQNNW